MIDIATAGDFTADANCKDVMTKIPTAGMACKTAKTTTPRCCRKILIRHRWRAYAMIIPHEKRRRQQQCADWWYTVSMLGLSLQDQWTPWLIEGCRLLVSHKLQVFIELTEETPRASRVRDWQLPELWSLTIFRKVFLQSSKTFTSVEWVDGNEATGEDIGGWVTKASWRIEIFKGRGSGVSTAGVSSQSRM